MITALILFKLWLLSKTVKYGKKGINDILKTTGYVCKE